ncbi:MAG: CoB--CoM heterodisulfide reductase iron-sulfur subunit B family protein [Desulfosalsimonadaceae bacterium]
MKYIYYPGCSLEGTALEYNISTKSVLGALGVELVELDDWTCCGATAAEGTSHLLSFALPARNIALAEKMKEDADILVPCSACYLNLKRVEREIVMDPGLLKKINQVLETEDLALKGKRKTRHLLDVLSSDIPARDIASAVVRPLKGLRIAPYYGCQCLRPYAVFDDPEAPRSMEPILAALGASVYDWDMGGKCCGASLMSTAPEAGIELVAGLLDAAQDADAVVTVCPMCQMNLEAYQRRASKMRKAHYDVPILYLPQLMGLAMGLPDEQTRLDLNLCVPDGFRHKLPDLQPV